MSVGIKRVLLVELGCVAVFGLLATYFWAHGTKAVGVYVLILALPFLFLVSQLAFKVVRGDEARRVNSRSVSPDEARLLLSRPMSSADDLLRKYLVSVDGKVVAKLDYGRAIDVTMSPGPHTIEAILGGSDKISEPLVVVLVKGERQQVEVVPSSTSTFVRRASDDWITVRHLRNA